MSAKIPLAYDSHSLKSPSSGVLGVASASSEVIPFETFAILPEEGDNAGICRKVTPRGTRFTLPGSSEIFVLNHTILEGHRFAVKLVSPGEHLKSWNLTFAEATRPILPGQYLANARVLAALRARGLTDLPDEPNIDDLIVPHEVDEAKFIPKEQVPLLPEAETSTFQGFAREGGRGVGTRNYIILVGTTSLSAGYVKALEAAVKKAGLVTLHSATVDGVVAVPHTEGTGNRETGYRPHNFDLVCTTLAAFCVHPNVAAAIVVDYGSNEEAVWGEDVVSSAGRLQMPLSAVPHELLRLTGDLEADLLSGLNLVKKHLPAAAACIRTPQPLSTLSVAQQCGGSDAFSGVSGNPCAGEACKLLIQMGGQAVLAETDELMGAESYILSKVRDLKTAQKFMGLINGFKERLSWHGQSAESNPSGGNQWRGLYNIGLKSLGAAKKKHADVSLDGVLDYGERTVGKSRGYYFMDSPGNDLESIAGQVATGCNLIYFITGNGSITNFPFVPTIKIVTTSERFKLLQKDMDFNAGRYQEGTSMVALGKELLDLTLTTASGVYSVGEKAGHAQVSLWRNWPQVGPTDITKFSYGTLGGAGLMGRGGEATPPASPLLAYPGAAPRGCAAVERLGLILPTSLCSGEVARKITENLNALLRDSPSLSTRVSRFECLPHTEGCGTGYPDGGINQYTRIMLGHLTHPSISMALCLEHGCEKTHNDFFSNALKDAGLGLEGLGFASIQLDGGIESVTAKVIDYFEGVAKSGGVGVGGNLSSAVPCSSRQPIDARSLDIGLMVLGGEKGGSVDSSEIALAAAALARGIQEAGGNLVLPASSPILRNPLFTDTLSLSTPPDFDSPNPVPPTIAFGEAVRAPLSASSSSSASGKLHIMDVPYVRDACEITTGLAATGCHAILVLSTAPRKGSARPCSGHPIVPVIHVGLGVPGKSADPAYVAAADRVYTPSHGDSPQSAALGLASAALETLTRVLGGDGSRAKSAATPFFSITRGPTGIST